MVRKYQNQELECTCCPPAQAEESVYNALKTGYTQILFNDEVIKGLAEKYNKSSAQILIRWHLQMGYICIPGSSNEDHVKEDYDVFDFELTDDEMKQIEALDKNERNANYQYEK